MKPLESSKFWKVTKEKLRELKELDDLLEKEIIDTRQILALVKDGIVNPEIYFSSNKKILWILKEANDTEIGEDGYIGNWDLRGFLKDDVTKYKYWRRTYLPIVYSSWSILNDCCDWSKIADYEDDPTILEILQNIAIINIKKLPGRSKSNESEISSAYRKHKQLLHKQIELIDPDIIIFGGTIHHFIDELKIPRESISRNSFYDDGRRIYIDNYHPNQRLIKRQDYCEHNIESVKACSKTDFT